jgi:hypothetical protein
MMAIRVVCFVIAVIVFAKGGGWLTAIPAVGAIAIPYFAVVFANGGREPSSTKGFRAYEPNMPAPTARPAAMPPMAACAVMCQRIAVTTALSPPGSGKNGRPRRRHQPSVDSR